MISEAVLHLIIYIDARSLEVSSIWSRIFIVQIMLIIKFQEVPWMM